MTTVDLLRQFEPRRWIKTHRRQRLYLAEERYAILYLDGFHHRRTKTQASFSTENAALTLLYGLVALGRIRFHKIDGHRRVASLTRSTEPTAA